jgi:hypothetical protein
MVVHFLRYTRPRQVVTGVWLSLVFLAWILIANVAFSPAGAQRNLIAHGIAGDDCGDACAALLRSGRIVISTDGLERDDPAYRILSLKFVLLQDYYSTFHVFVLGAVAYLLFATLSWIGMIVLRARAAQGTHTSR